MATEKSSSDLQNDINTVITSQTTPDAITPTSDGGLRADSEVSAYNKVDGIEIGLHGRDLVPPALFTSTINPSGQTLEQVIQALMDAANADHISITGGVQGRAGEFLSNITSDTRQTIAPLVSGTVAMASLARIKFPNDRDNGCFDNGNNFLVDQFVTPAGGQGSVKTSGVGLILDIITNNITANGGASGYNFQCKIIKGTSTVLASSNIVSIRDGGGTGELYFSDFDTGTIALAAADIISIELWIQSVSMVIIGSTPQIIAQLKNGFIVHQII